MQQQLVIYDAACRALAQAKTIDEIKEITNRAEAARAYARQAKNRQLELDAIEIRVRAERRLGEIIIILKEEKQIRVGGPGAGHVGERPPVTLKELGIDSDISAGAQRLAKLPEQRFFSEIKTWRKSAEVSQRVEIPLQRYRIPSIHGDRQKAAARLGRIKIDQNDILDKFRAPDGRRIADWRYGELDRIRQLADRAIRCVDGLREAMPIANPEPLDTMEMIFASAALLAETIEPIWESVSITPGKTGIDDARFEASLNRRQRICARCGVEFVMKHAPYAGRPSEGKFCSRKCAKEKKRVNHSFRIKTPAATGRDKRDIHKSSDVK